MKKQYPIAFYFGLLAFIYIAFFGRGLLQPATHGISAWISIALFLLLPLVYQNLVTRGTVAKLLSGVTFFLMFVFFWETMNIIPMLFLGFSLITKSMFNSFFGIDYLLPYIKTIAIFVTVFVCRKSWIGFMSTLFSSFQTTTQLLSIDGQAINKEDKELTNNQKASLFFNKSSGIMSVYTQKNKGKIAKLFPRIDYVYQGNPLLLLASDRPAVEKDSTEHLPVYDYQDKNKLVVWSKKGNLALAIDNFSENWRLLFGQKIKNKTDTSDDNISF